VGRGHVDPGDLRPEDVVRLEKGRVVLLDQRRLPGELVELHCRSSGEVAEAIRTLAVRGAPAIGVAAAMGYALAAAAGEDLDEAAATLLASRPTAVNLAFALAEMRRVGSDRGRLAARARELHREEVARCVAMGEHAAVLLDAGEWARPLTHCNTGALATAGHGSALGAIRSAHALGRVEHVFVDETRPLLQGSRLTAWELERARIPFSVVVDGAAGSLMARREATLVVVGADRIAANGDVANKIGTYSLAVLAAHHDIPFVVVAPTSTVDLEAASGAQIPIEERAAEEVTGRFAARNPAFDVTPAKLVTAIVTEVGVHEPPYGPALRDAVSRSREAESSSASSGAAGKGAEPEARRTVRHGTAERRGREILPPAAPGSSDAGLRPAGAAAGEEAE
jgi:methylthioribose-1-phosphate isomerase